MILEMFLNGLKQLHIITITNNESNDLKENSGLLTAEVIMIDIIAQQVFV